jgi:hypothetical protein
MNTRDTYGDPVHGSHNPDTGLHTTGADTTTTTTTTTHPTHQRGILGGLKDAAENIKDKTLETTDEIGNRMRGDNRHTGYEADVSKPYGTASNEMHGTTGNYGTNNATGMHTYTKEHTTPVPAATGANSTAPSQGYGANAYGSNTYGTQVEQGQHRTFGQQAKDAAGAVGEKTRDTVDVLAEKMHRK